MAEYQTKTLEDDWRCTWEGHRETQLRSWQQTTPQQRLAWLEEAIQLAHKSGALPKQYLSLTPH